MDIDTVDWSSSWSSWLSSSRCLGHTKEEAAQKRRSDDHQTSYHLPLLLELSRLPLFPPATTSRHFQPLLPAISVLCSLFPPFLRLHFTLCNVKLSKEMPVHNNIIVVLDQHTFSCDKNQKGVIPSLQGEVLEPSLLQSNHVEEVWRRLKYRACGLSHPPWSWIGLRFVFCIGAVQRRALLFL